MTLFPANMIAQAAPPLAPLSGYVVALHSKRQYWKLLPVIHASVEDAEAVGQRETDDPEKSWTAYRVYQLGEARP